MMNKRITLVELGKPLFLQMEPDGGGTFLLLGTPETLSADLGVRLTFTPEILLRRAAKKFNARCQFISLEEFKRKTALAQDPASNIFDVMHFYRPKRD